MYVRFVLLQFSFGNALILFISYTCFILIRWFLRLAWQVSQVASHFSSDEMNCTRFWNQHGLTCWHLLLAFWLYLTRISVLTCRLVDMFFEKEMLIITVTYLYSCSSNIIFPWTCAQRYCWLVQSIYPSGRRATIKPFDGFSANKLCSSQGYDLNIFLDHFKDFSMKNNTLTRRQKKIKRKEQEKHCLGRANWATPPRKVCCF